MTSQIEVISRYFTLIAPRRKDMPIDNKYNSIRKIGTINQVQLGVTPFMRAKIMMTTRLIDIFMTAVKVAEITTIYFGKLIFLNKPPRVTMACMP